MYIVRWAGEAAKQLGSEAARFLKDARTIRRKGDKFVSGKDAIARHSEVRQNRKNLADHNSKQLQKIKTLFFETDQVSLSDWQIRPTSKNFAPKSISHKINIGGVGTPPYYPPQKKCS